MIALSGLAFALTKKDGSANSSIIYLLVLARYLFPVAARFVREGNFLGANESELCIESCFLGAKAVFAAVLYLVSKQL